MLQQWRRAHAPSSRRLLALTVRPNASPAPLVHRRAAHGRSRLPTAQRQQLILSRQKLAPPRMLTIARGGVIVEAPHRGPHNIILRAALCSQPSGGSTSGSGDAVSKAAPKAVAPARWTPAWMWNVLKETALHYWHGSKLLAADIRVASKLFGRLLVGRTLSRREHNLLVRVSADIARLVPLSFFVIVPMMEFALPFALKLFPNLLPSTFEEKHHRDEKRMKLLKVRQH